MASLFGWPFLFLRDSGLEQYSDRHRNERQRRAVRVHAVVSCFDERLEAAAKRNLDSATDVPAEVVRGAGVPTAKVCARAIESHAANCVRRERHAERELIRQVAGERGDIDVAAATLETELIVCSFGAD